VAIFPIVPKVRPPSVRSNRSGSRTASRRAPPESKLPSPGRATGRRAEIK
jgi:hypothetical protein